jgi:hypothetical protein
MNRRGPMLPALGQSAGSVAQIALYQALLSVASSLLAIGCFALERAAGWPLLVAALHELPGSKALRLLDAICSETAATALHLHRATVAVGTGLREFLGDIGGLRIDAATSARWLALQRKQTGAAPCRR